MQHARFLMIVTLGAILVALALSRGVGPAPELLIERARSIQTALRSDCPRATARGSDPSLVAGNPKPGIAAFLAFEGRLFRILVGRDGEGGTWSAAVSGEE